MFQTDNKKLMKNIVAEEIDYDNTIKVGLAMEQADKKVEEMRGKNSNKEEELPGLTKQKISRTW